MFKYTSKGQSLSTGGSDTCHLHFAAPSGAFECYKVITEAPFLSNFHAYCSKFEDVIIS